MDRETAKLKTTQNVSHDLIDATDENLIYDALYAHALVQAMELTLYANGIMRVERAADELMREWGAK